MGSPAEPLVASADAPLANSNRSDRISDDNRGSERRSHARSSSTPAIASPSVNADRDGAMITIGSLPQAPVVRHVDPLQRLKEARSAGRSRPPVKHPLERGPQIVIEPVKAVPHGFASSGGKH